MEVLITKRSYPFLEGGGEMGALTRDYKWEETSIGAPIQWPQNLRTTVSMILSSNFPMFLWWGADLIQFYNDAYRSSLGNGGKHPPALGQKAIDCWPETWNVIYPLISQVQTTGEATLSEDELIPIYRNGRMEDVYWTFGYSPIWGDNDNVDGVLVVCQETTDKVLSVKKLLKSNENLLDSSTKYRAAFDNMRGNSMLVQVNIPGYNILAVTEGFTQSSGKSKELLLGRGVFEAFPANPHDKHDRGARDLLHSFELVITSKKPHQLPIQRYDVPDENGHFIERYWSASNTPVLDNDGNVSHIINTVEEITEQVKAKQKIEQAKSMEQAHSLFMQAPVAIHIIKGEDLIIELANNETLALWGKGKEVIGKRLEEALPEIAGQGIVELLQKVMDGGQPFEANETPVFLVRDGKKQEVFVNYLLHPYYQEDKLKASGVIVIATEVTEKMIAQKEVLESEQKFRNVVEQSNYAISILKGPDLLIEVANAPLLRIWGKGTEVIGKPVSSVIPEAAAQGFLTLLNDVYENGKTHSGFEVPATMSRREGEPVTLYFDFVYQPYRDSAGKITGVMVLANDITERVKAKKELAENKQSLDLAIQIGELGVFTIDVAQTDFLQSQAAFSPKIMEWFEVEHGTMLMHKIIDRIHPEDKSMLISKIKHSLLEGDGKHDFVYRVQQSGGNLLYLRSIGKTEFINGIARSISGIIQDVTPEVLVNQKLEKSEENLRNIITQAPVAMCIFKGPEHVVEITNDRMLKLWGRLKADILNKPIFESLPEAKNQGFEALLHKVYTTGETVVAYGRSVTFSRDGVLETLYLNFVYEAYKEEDGTISGIMAVASDVTEQLLATKKTEESEVRFRLLADAMPQFVWTADKEGRLNYFNRAVYQYSGMTEEHILNGGWIEIVHPEEREENIRQWLASVETGVDFHFHHRFKNKEGEYKWQLSRATPQKDDEGNIQMWIGTSTDIHEHKMFEEELQTRVTAQTKELLAANERLLRSNQELARSNTNLEEFAYAASHDMKEPIRKIHFFADRIKDSLTKRFEADELKYFDRMEAAAKRMGNLIDDLLSYSQVSVRPRLLDDVDLNHIIKQVLHDLDLEIDEKKAQLILEDFPVIKGYPRQIQQAFQNLISNALKFHKPGQAPVISITCKQVQGKESLLALSLEEQEKNYYLIEIRDEGIGFDQVESERIFNVFTRLHGNTEYKGTGVGLSIVRKVAENHQGFVVAKSALNNGAVFQVYFPSYQ